MTSNLPPFRADHVGSLLRPPQLKQAARDFHAGRISGEEMTAAQDQAIREAVAMQEAVGLRTITDGEFRRVSWYGGFVQAVEGLTNRPADFRFRGEDGEGGGFDGVYTEAKIARGRGIAVPELSFIQPITSQIPKVTLPAPSAMHFFRFHDPMERSVYPDDEAFWSDLVAVYHQELAALAEAGATFVQFDECPCIMMADPEVRKTIESKGSDPETLIHAYLEAMKAVLQGRPEGMRTAMHLCRGNYKGQWIASGGYDAIAERLFTELDFDAYYLEYDSERAGDFAPLRFLAPGKTVVLGLVNSKRPNLETPAELTRRIDEAARHVPLEQLAISPQCGFASSVGGNPLTLDDQTAKLRRLVEVAEEVWG